MKTYTGGKTKCRRYDVCGNKENCSRCKPILKKYINGFVAFCPNCHQEYKKEIPTTCKKCGNYLSGHGTMIYIREANNDTKN